MVERVRRVLLCVAASALLGPLGCGAPSAEEAEALSQTRRALISGPDFVVRSIQSPPSAWPWGPFPVEVTVCNQGSVGESTHVDLFLSEDSDISPLDTNIGSTFPQWLEAGQCFTETLYTNIDVPQGAWYTGGIADPFNATAEADEGNNTQVGALIGVGNGPDYIIQAVRGPTGVRSGEWFEASVTVCNQGTQGGATDVQLVLSEDADIVFSPNDPPEGQDLPLHSFFTDYLEAGQCSTQQVQLSVSPPQEGAWHLGAVANMGNLEELVLKNNMRASELMGVGTGPDYTVESVSAPASLQPGEWFTASVRVCNRGTQFGSTEVQLVFSQDTDIVFSPNGPPEEQDLPVTSFYADYLEPGRCRTHEVQLSYQPPEEGAWYLGAVADAGSFENELIESNNTRASQVIGVGLRTDYIIQAVSGPASVVPGNPFTASVTVCNQGTQYGGTEVLLVLSQDTDIRFSYDGPPYGQDLPVMSFYSQPLAPGQCDTQQVQASAYVPYEGAWYLGAVADPGEYEQELLESNNTRAGNAMGVGHRPDYVIQAVSGPASVRPGDPFMASVTVCNQGTQGIGTEVSLVLSQDTDIRFSYDGPPYGQDLLLTSFFVHPLEAGQCTTQQVLTQVGVPFDGAWYLGAVADAGQYEHEFIESNNTRASEAMGVGHAADLVVQALTAPASTRPGDGFEASVTVCNQGTQGGYAEVQLVLSEDTDIRFSYDAPPYEQDLPLNTVSLGMLEPGQCRTQQAQTNAPMPYEGGWYLGAVVDPWNSEHELIESNNTRASNLMGVGYRPDYIIQSVSAPASTRPGDTFTAAVTVCNQGTEYGSTEVMVVFSQDADIRFSYMGSPSNQDMPITSFYSEPLEPGQCRTHQVQGSVYPFQEGPAYLGAVADPGESEQELIESNNTRASQVMGVGMRPDYTIQAVNAPAGIRPGDPFTASVTVCNQGTEGGATEVMLVLSQDADIRFSYEAPPYTQDMAIASFYSEPLEPGQCRTQQVETNVYPPQDGVWYLGAVADPGDSEQELIETNNTLASKPVGIGYRPDYIIQSVSVPASVRFGDLFTASVTVCNQGTQGGATEVQLVLSEDTNIRFSYQGPPYNQDMPIGNFYSEPLEPGQCRTQQVETNVYPPQEGAWHIGAVADPGESEEELIETNNTLASQAMGVGQRPDYIIQAVSVPASVRPGDPFTASVTVCNQGTQGGATEVQLVLSEDTDIRFSYQGPPYNQDMPIGNFYSEPLEPGQCRTQQVETSVYPPQEGAWYVGAVADPGSYEEEFIETNNTLASQAMGVGQRSDYIIQSVSVPASAVPGEPFMVSVTVCNQGTQGGGTDVQLVLSEDTDIRFSYQGQPWDQDMPIGSFFSDLLEPGRCQTQQVETNVYPPQEGAWHIGAVADPGSYEEEFIETNNTLASAPIGIGMRADYIIQSVSGPASVRPGEPFTAVVTVCNQGTQYGGTEVQLVLSQDADIRFSYQGQPWDQDMPITSFYSDLMEPGQCNTVEVETNMYPPQEGAWHLGAVADPGHYEEELIENNNTRASELIGVGDGPDYIIQSVTGPASVRPGQTFTVKVTVCNQGTMSGGTEVQLVLSEDTDIRFSYQGQPWEQDMPIGGFPVGPLSPGQCTTQQMQTSVYPSQDGAWYLGALADPGNYEQELLEHNNTAASAVVGIGDAPDLVIRTLSGPTSVRMGNQYSASVKVCNQGTAPSSAEVQLVLSQDTDIRFSYNGPWEEQDMPVEFFTVSNLSPGACVTRSVAISVPPEDPGAWYLGAVADPGSYLEELIETNNTRASNVISFYP